MSQASIDDEFEADVEGNAGALRWDRAPLTSNAQHAVDHLMLELEESENRQRARRKADRDRLATTLSALALELYAASRSPGNSFRRYGRGKADYDQRDRYRPAPVTHTTAITAADWLVATGYAEGRLGYYQRFPGFGKNVGAGELSRLCATSKLHSLFEGEFELSIHHVGFAPWTETVILRGAASERGGIKPDIPYTDTVETNAMRAKLQRINDALADFKISLQGAHGALEDMPPFRLRRIFSRGSFELGGRFYGGPWIDMPSEERPFLLIDGEETVELDFSSLHPRLIYQSEGKALPVDADPYDVLGWAGKERRGWVKTAFQQLLNAEPDMPLYKPREIKSDELANGGWQRLLRDIERAHSGIAGWFRSGRGLELQRIDSDVAEAILLAMLDQGICCLPIHDSFIVPSSHEQELRQAMKQAHHEVLARRGYAGEDPVIHARRPAVLFQ